MGRTAIPTVTTGDLATAAWANTYLRDNEAEHWTQISAILAALPLLTDPPKVRLTVTTDFSSTTSIANIAWENEVFDTDAMWDSAVNANRIYFPTAGLYLITLQVIFSSGTAGSYRHAGLYKKGDTGSVIGGQTVSAASGAVMPVNVSALYQFSAAEYLTAKVQSGENENITDCMITAVRVSD